VLGNSGLPWATLEAKPETDAAKLIMERVLIDFVDFPNLERADNPLLPILQKRFELISSEWPDFLFFTHEGRRHQLYSCTKIFYSHERYRPNWKHCDYALSSIKLDDPRAFHVPFYSMWRKPDDLIRRPGEDYRAALKAKSGFCSFLTWYDDRSVKTRSDFFKKLHARKPVDSAGRALNNTGWRVPLGRAPKIEFLKRYKFNICFENADIPGWTTEKFTDALAAGTVPIFYGDITVKEQFNKEAFIDRRDFDSDEACIEHILKVDADDALYLKYLSATPFYNNVVNKEWNHERLLDFLEKIFTTPQNPIARRRWFSRLTKWRLVKRIKEHGQKGQPKL
jgi:alpha(1,3/1,4) fucosyltransferase